MRKVGVQISPLFNDLTQEEKMGEIAEMMLDGAMCEQCGEFIDDGEECGYPRLCAGCQLDQPEDDLMAPRFLQEQAGAERRVACPQCGKRVKEAGLADHTRVKHRSDSAPAPGGDHG